MKTPQFIISSCLESSIQLTSLLFLVISLELTNKIQGPKEYFKAFDDLTKMLTKNFVQNYTLNTLSPALNTK